MLLDKSYAETQSVIERNTDNDYHEHGADVDE